MAWILVGDIGGTKTNFALVESRDKHYTLQQFATFSSHARVAASHVISLQEILAKYLEQIDPIKPSELTASLAIAGPVTGPRGVCRTTNLPWVVDAGQLARELHIPNILLLNDLHAGAFAIDVLEKQDFFVLQEGQTAEGNRALVAPGTGLGEAGLFWDGKRYHPFATEGGHTDFGPTDELQLELAKYLIARFKHASYERVVSGQGIATLFEFLRDVKGCAVEKALQEEITRGDPAHVISMWALKGKSAICEKTVDLFIRLLAQESGNVALKFMSLGGLFLGGGIPPKVLDKLKEAVFLEYFCAKGRFQELLRGIPVQVILNPLANLKGAAHFAAHT